LRLGANYIGDFRGQGKIFRETRTYGNNLKIVNYRQPLKFHFSIYKTFFFVVHSVQPLLQVPKNFDFRSPVTISCYGVTSLNETSLPHYDLVYMYQRILHWDGKIMDDFTGLNPGKVQVDQLPILVSGENVVKLLSVLKLHSGTADVTATAIMNVIDEWRLQDHNYMMLLLRYNGY
jgi:hypothetical protein